MGVLKTLCSLLALLIGLSLLVIAAAIFFYLPKMVRNRVVEADFLGMEKGNGTEVPNAMTRQWAEPPYDMRLQLWLYHVDNEKDVMNGEKPSLKEIGPFTFMEKQQKSYDFSHNGTRVIYQNNRKYFFNRTLSCCDLDVKVTIPNILFQKLAQFSTSGFWARNAIEILLIAEKRETAFITVSAGEALFEGYEDPLLTRICNTPVLQWLCSSFPKRIGFYYGQNNTSDGTYEVHSGLGDAFSIGKMYSWNNMTNFPENTWDSRYAAMINGTDGQLFPPLLVAGQSITVFGAQICRSLPLAFSGKTSFEEVDTFRYSMPLSLFDPSVLENKQFCNKNNTPVFFSNPLLQEAGCLPKGLLDVSRCQPGQPPIYISFGHLYGALPEVQNMTTGSLSPSVENDVTYVDVEPNAGVPIRANRVMQINVGMVKGELRVLANTSNMIVPVLWMNETAFVDNGTRNELKNELQRTLFIAFWGGIILFAISLIGTSFLVYVVFLRPSTYQNLDEQPILADDSNIYEDNPAAQVGESED